MQRIGDPSDTAVVVCTYNRAKQLRKTIDSLLHVAHPFAEIIVVDNNSTDETESVVKSFLHSGKVRYVKEMKQGIAHARNRGLDECKNRYLAFIDDDESVASFWLESMFQGLALAPNVAVVAGPTIPVYESEPPAWLPEGLHDAYRYLPNDSFVLDKTAGIGTGNVLIDMQIVGDLRFKTSIGRIGTRPLGGEDVDFFYRLLAEKSSAVYVPHATVYHFISNGKLTLKWHTRRYFYEGVTEYLLKGNSILLKRCPKLFLDSAGIIFALLSLKSKKVSYKFFRLCQTTGILLGPMWLWREKRAKGESQ